MAEEDVITISWPLEEENLSRFAESQTWPIISSIINLTIIVVFGQIYQVRHLPFRCLFTAFSLPFHRLFPAVSPPFPCRFTVFSPTYTAVLLQFISTFLTNIENHRTQARRCLSPSILLFCHCL